MASWEQAGPATPHRSSARREPAGATVARASATALYAGAIFLSAFLLFQVEPIMGRLILPWFGGSAAVWTVAVLFFQVVLVLGYLYAHLLARHVAPRRQALVHVPLLLASLLVLPILPSAAWKPVGGQDPTLRIIGLLTLTVGPPFLVLSTCGPLLQAWFSRGDARPYRLFAVSNAASLAGLLSYPLLLEPLVGAHLQADLWSAAYAAFVALAIVITIRAGRSAAEPAPAASPAPAAADRPGWADLLRWLALAAVPSLLFLAVTNHLTRNVAPIPLLWVLPLGIYLLSLILCFEGARGYRRGLFLPLLPITLALVAANLLPGELDVGVVGQIAFFCGALLVCCMVCHGELARLKPPAEHLTAFYLMVAVGGALGGLFVAVIAPEVFSDYFELALGIVLCAGVVAVTLVPGMLRGSGRGAWMRRALALAAVAFTVLLGCYVLAKVRRYHDGDRLVARDFYGVLSVREQGSGAGSLRVLYSGTIVHGEQLLRPGLRREPISYYGPASGLGVLMREEDRRREPLRVGVVGLGAGTIAAFGRAGDSYLFYEIDPLDIRIARTEFSYLRESRARVGIVEGDGRLSLERERPQRFDALAVDAFSGDSIPIHLLTVQAFRLYFRNLLPDGVLAVNISNRFLDLAPVVARAAAALGRSAVLIEDAGEPGEVVYKRSEWVLLTAEPRLAARLEREGHGRLLGPARGTRLWTDDYSDVLGALR